MMKAWKSGLVAGLLLVQLPAAGLAQGIDPVTGFPRDPVPVAAWPAAKKVAVSFALFVETFGFGQGRCSALISRAATRIWSTRRSANTPSTGASRASVGCSRSSAFRSPWC